MALSQIYIKFFKVEELNPVTIAGWTAGYTAYNYTF